MTNGMRLERVGEGVLALGVLAGVLFLVASTFHLELGGWTPEDILAFGGVQLALGAGLLLPLHLQ